ncbi:RluA family pseudouridine synthase [Sporosarcina limicola]|uniref:Pseudouridine synthase n=1 Tax=Sporosarcina limicola TaxID=34101 RepID=A0A927MHZ1_9BACL|nr:RluA family pseudouridine synthase [Sporosarcina limicola]MBE1554218.1 23S rRNA pseudouridine1911/1915/1917 synthase [Sporosarcina limicola]
MRKNHKNSPNRNTDSSIYKVEEPIELLPFLIKMMTKSSRNSVKSVLTRGQVTVDGKMIKQHNHPLQIGQTVAILKNQAAMKEDALVGIEILYEDDVLIAVNKDAGILSVAAKNEEEMTAYRQIKQYVKKENLKNRVFVVHRLDRDTSGVMLFAKSEDIKKKLQEAWNEVVKERTYTALVEGVVRKKEGTISSWLKESKTFKVHSNPTDNGGQHAITHYKTLQSNKQFTLLQVQLETGRKNQIRVHMEELGHPVVGDKKYGSTINPIKRLGLHATALALVHPTTGELIRFQADAPKNFISKTK